MNPTYCTIILAGGRSSRMGRNKVTLQVEGTPLISTAVGAVPDSVRTVLVGPRQAIVEGLGVGLVDDETLVQTQENPPYGGPVAGMVAGLRQLEDVQADLVAVLACDIPGVSAAVADLLSDPSLDDLAISHVNDGVCALAEDGHPQWLLGFYRLDYLRNRALVAGGRGGSVRRFLEGARLVGVRMPEKQLQDVDTPADLVRYLARP